MNDIVDILTYDYGMKVWDEPNDVLHILKNGVDEML